MVAFGRSVVAGWERLYVRIWRNASKSAGISRATIGAGARCQAIRRTKPQELFRQDEETVDAVVRMRLPRRKR